MPAPYSNLRSKLNRAICAWLVNQSCGSVNDTFPANSRKTRKFPNTTIRSTIGRPEPVLTGTDRVQVHISIKGSATQQPNEPNEEAARLAFDERCAKIKDALMQSDDDQTLRYTARAITAAGRALAVAVNGTDEATAFAARNADMTDFTCQAWYDAGEGDGEAEDAGCDWEEIFLFEAIACPSNVD